MENITCPSCGNETPDILTRCKHCGERLSEDRGTEQSETSPIKERAKVTSIYFGLASAINLLFCIAYFCTIFTRIGLWSAYDPMSSRIYGFVNSAIVFVGYMMLLRWKKMGWYIIAAMAGINQVISFIEGGSSILTYAPLISLFILFVVMQIKKNGKSCWEQLS